MRIHILLQNSFISILVVAFLGFTPDVLQAAQGQTTAQVQRVTLTELQQNFYKAEIEEEISVEFENKILEEALAQIARATGLKLTYRGDLIVDKKVSLKRESISVSDALDFVLEGTGFDYKISRDGYLMIVEADDSLDEAIFQESVSGRVIDAVTGESLPGVNILIEATDTGTSTDIDGNYELTVPSLDINLRFTYIGYQTLEIQIDGRTEINVSLQQITVSGEELVVIGYGEIRRSDLTGSITSVSAEQITQMPTTNVMEGLQGKVPGMDLTRNSGQPGSGLNITVRGNRSLTASNAPLFLVDGTQYDSIEDINPADIQSIEILKDASSTAIYGSRGANGVILVTTKQARRDGVTEVNVSSYLGVNQLYAFPHIMSGPEFADFKREQFRTVGQWSGPEDDSNIFVPDHLEYVQSGEWANYFDYLFQPGLQQEHQIGISRGNENMRVYLSFNYFDEEGILELDHLQRFTGRLNIDQQLSDALRLGLNTQVTYTDHDRRNNPIGRALNTSPHHSAFNEDGSINIVGEDRQGQVSPLADVVPGKFKDNQRSVRLFPTLYLDYSPNNNLHFRSNLTMLVSNGNRGIFRASETIGIDHEDNRTSYNTDSRRNLTIENIATYQRDFSDHSASMTLIHSYMYNKREFASLEGRGQLLEGHLYHAMGNAPNNVVINSSYTENSLQSYAGRLNYGYNHKYLLTLTGRFDGSSILSDGNKWAFFPSAALAWRVVEEGFMMDQHAFSDLKIRLSYGRSGNDAISPYSTQTLLAREEMSFSESIVPAYAFSSQLGNAGLEWEMSTTANLGLDIGLLSNRIYATVDLYNTYTTNLLLERILPLTSGVSSVVQNVGETRNRGIEIALRTENVRTDNIRWSSDITFFANKEEILQLVSKEDNIANGWFIGQPTQVYYDYEKIGIWQEHEAAEAASFNQIPGQIKVRDQNEDGVISASNDRVILGTARPKWSGGFENTVNYKSFDFNLFLYARIGQMMNMSWYNNLFRDGVTYNGLLVDYWTPENPSNTYPRPWGASPFISTLGYENASFVKLRSATIGYTLPENIAQAISVRSLRFYITGRNLLTFTQRGDYDPERGGASSYPMSRLFIAGIDLQF